MIVVVLNWNGINDTMECMGSLLPQLAKITAILLMDNDSDNNEGEILSQLYGEQEKVRIHIHEKNLGFAKAHNWAFDYIFENFPGEEYIALLNNDAVAHPDWARELLKSAKEYNADLISSKMINYFDRSKMDKSGHKMLNTGEIVPKAYNINTNSCDHFDINVGPCGGACLYSTEMLREIGLFDEYFETGYEDAELGMRAVVLKYRSIYAPKAIVYHKISQSINKVINLEYSIKIQKNILYTYFKLMPFLFVVVNLPIFFVKYFALLLLNIIFFRKGYLKIMVLAWYELWTKEKKILLKSRQKFQIRNKGKLLSTYSVLSRMHFFLPYDLKRFWNYFIIQKKPSNISLK